MDCIYCNGKIITMEGECCEDLISNAPEAVLVSDGIIKAVGSLDSVKQQTDSKAEIIDLEGRCLMPSFIDPHSHIVMNGQMSLCALLHDCESYDDIIKKLKEYISTHNIAAENLVIGFGYDHNFLREGGQPDKRILDQVSREIPIFILHISAHLACANSAALELAGIGAETKDPAGGMIGRLADGKEPSGYLEEAAMALVQKAIAGKMQFDFSSMVMGMQENYIENGVTTVQDGATTENDLKMLKAVAAAGQLKIDVVAYPLMSSGGENLLHSNMDLNRQYKRRLKIGGYKLVLDGSPQGRSAWMSQPYLGGEEGYCGYPWMTDQQVENFVKTAVKERQQLLVHCNGDAASEQYLNAYEKAIMEDDCPQNLRPVMIHCQTVRNDQLDRMARLNMIASIFVGHVWYWGDVHMKNFGSERGHHISPVQDALVRGICVNFHQDTPVTQPNMMHSVWCAVNRISRKGAVIGEDQKISVLEALKAITINAAYEYFEEDTKGSIRVGKRADFVILDRSPLEVDPIEIKNIQVMKTIKDGVVIFERNEIRDCVE